MAQNLGVTAISILPKIYLKSTSQKNFKVGENRCAFFLTTTLRNLWISKTNMLAFGCATFWKLSERPRKGYIGSAYLTRTLICLVHPTLSIEIFVCVWSILRRAGGTRSQFEASSFSSRSTLLPIHICHQLQNSNDCFPICKVFG